MFEEAVRQQLQEALLALEEDGGGEHPAPSVSTLRDYGMMTSDEGLVLDYGEGGIFTLHLGTYRAPELPDREAV